MRGCCDPMVKASYKKSFDCQFKPYFLAFMALVLWPAMPYQN